MSDIVEVGSEGFHRLVFENEYVRIFNVEVPAGEATLVHWHERDYVAVIVGPAVVEDEPTGEAPRRKEYTGGETPRGERGFTHRVRNVGEATFRNVVVEFKR